MEARRQGTRVRAGDAGHPESPPPAINGAQGYDIVGERIGEIYDLREGHLDDLMLILSLLGPEPRRVLEPFCGTGRILLPLAMAGHCVVGFDLSQSMLACLAAHARRLPAAARRRLTCQRADAVADPWPAGFEAVVLGSNCLYELAGAEEQVRCIRAAALALEPGGHLYLDNDHMEGDLEPGWRAPGIHPAFPGGVCSDGTVVDGTIETIWHDAALRLVRLRRTVTVRSPGGRVERREWVQQKHPPSTQEMERWLEESGFAVEALWGDRNRGPYEPGSPRAVFWAVKR